MDGFLLFPSFEEDLELLSQPDCPDTGSLNSKE
jgi:hypothetical protein